MNESKQKERERVRNHLAQAILAQVTIPTQTFLQFDGDAMSVERGWSLLPTPLLPLWTLIRRGGSGVVGRGCSLLRVAPHGKSTKHWCPPSAAWRRRSCGAAGRPLTCQLHSIGEAIPPIPQARLLDTSGEHIVDLPFPQSQERIDAPKVVPEEPVQQHTVDHVVDMPALRILEDIVEATHFPQEQFAERIFEQTFDVPDVEVVNAIPQKRLQQRTAEQVADLQFPQIQEAIVKMIQALPQERTSDRAGEKLIDVPGSQFQEQIVEELEANAGQRVQQGTVKLIADMPAPQSQGQLVEVTLSKFCTFLTRRSRNESSTP